MSNSNQTARKNANLAPLGSSSLDKASLTKQTTSCLLGLPRLQDYAGIFLVSASVLLFELALTRVFAVVLWAHLAFMVVSTALFGFGLSGVYLALRSASQASRSKQQSLSALALFVSCTIIGAYLVISYVPFRIWKIHDSAWNYFYLALWYGALVVPFFFAGLLIARLLAAFPARSSRLYGLDLLGAAAGSLSLIPVITYFGGEGSVVFSAMMAAAAGLCLARSGQKRVFISLLAVLLVLGAILPQADQLLAIKLHQTKRRYNKAVKNGHIQATRWSPISRVDIAYQQKDILDIWIDGGTNESAILKWSGEESKFHPDNYYWSTIATIPALKMGTYPRVLIIGPSGGKEVLSAVVHGASHVDAVEMDPSISYFTTHPPYDKFMGYLYQNPKVSFVNDEGRSFLRRQPKGSYDIIQFVNNYAPGAIAAGALNLSETFLITKEAFNDYLDRLTPDGVLALHRGATLRVALTAIAALRERGAANPAKHILITDGDVPYFEGFFLKKSEWTAQEVQKVKEYVKSKIPNAENIALFDPLLTEGKDVYHKVLNAPAEEQEKYYTALGINLFPATDDRPFVEHFLQIGKKDLSIDLPKEFRTRNAEKWRGIIPKGDFPYFAILAESGILALLFIGLPLLLRARGSMKLQGFWGLLGYFASLGFGFISVEICLMKRYVLFLGNPSYAITTILVMLLLGAGAGSIVSEKFSAIPARKALAWAVPLLVLALLSETLVSPLIFNAFLGLEFGGRLLVASMLLFPLGFMMGMPFPLGLKLISEMYPDEVSRTQLTAWVWGINGYLTVIGSAATVFIALFWGFKAALFIGIASYLLGLSAVLLTTRGQNS